MNESIAAEPPTGREWRARDALQRLVASAATDGGLPADDVLAIILTHPSLVGAALFETHGVELAIHGMCEAGVSTERLLDALVMAGALPPAKRRPDAAVRLAAGIRRVAAGH